MDNVFLAYFDFSGRLYNCMKLTNENAWSQRDNASVIDKTTALESAISFGIKANDFNEAVQIAKLKYRELMKTDKRLMFTGNREAACL